MHPQASPQTTDTILDFQNLLANPAIQSWLCAAVFPQVNATETDKPQSKAYCIDCKHSLCLKNQGFFCGFGMPADPVTGETRTTTTCALARAAHGECGTDGRHFEKRLQRRSQLCDDISQVCHPTFDEPLKPQRSLDENRRTNELCYQAGIVLGITLAELFIQLAASGLKVPGSSADGGSGQGLL